MGDVLDQRPKSPFNWHVLIVYAPFVVLYFAAYSTYSTFVARLTTDRFGRTRVLSGLIADSIASRTELRPYKWVKVTTILPHLGVLFSIKSTMIDSFKLLELMPDDQMQDNIIDRINSVENEYVIP